jgi:hypothetical protein
LGFTVVLFCLPPTHISADTVLLIQMAAEHQKPQVSNETKKPTLTLRETISTLLKTWCDELASTPVAYFDLRSDWEEYDAMSRSWIPFWVKVGDFFDKSSDADIKWLCAKYVETASVVCAVREQFIKLTLATVALPKNRCTTSSAPLTQAQIAAVWATLKNSRMSESS